MKFLLLLIVAGAFFVTGEALECYSCSWPDTGCDDPFDESAAGVTKKTCSQPLCEKYVTTLSNGTSGTQRGCSSGLKNSPKLSERATPYVGSVTANFCDSNLCNGVSHISAALSVLMVSALPFLLRNHH